jgi:hypothetical protein
MTNWGIFPTLANQLADQFYQERIEANPFGIARLGRIGRKSQPYPTLTLVSAG